VRFGKKIGHVDLYGGEVMLLPSDYLLALKNMLLSYGVDDIEIITNLSVFKEDILSDTAFGLSVSYDF
jgi:hypothetical protein